MFDIKKHIIKHFTTLKVVHSIPGRIRIKVSNINKLPDECKNYDEYLKIAVTMLDGIEEVKFNYVIGTILISYSIDKLYESKVLKWIDKIVEIGLNNIDLIKEYGENNIDYVIKTLEQQLQDSLKKI